MAHYLKLLFWSLEKNINGRADTGSRGSIVGIPLCTTTTLRNDHPPVNRHFFSDAICQPTILSNDHSFFFFFAFKHSITTNLWSINESLPVVVQG